MTKCRAGSRIYKGCEVPITAVIHTSQLGREYYISAVENDESYIRFIDDGTFLKINSKRLK